MSPNWQPTSPDSGPFRLPDPESPLEGEAALGRANRQAASSSLDELAGWSTDLRDLFASGTAWVRPGTGELRGRSGPAQASLAESLDAAVATALADDASDARVELVSRRRRVTVERDGWGMESLLASIERGWSVSITGVDPPAGEIWRLRVAVARHLGAVATPRLEFGAGTSLGPSVRRRAVAQLLIPVLGEHHLGIFTWPRRVTDDPPSESEVLVSRPGRWIALPPNHAAHRLPHDGDRIDLWIDVTPLSRSVIDSGRTTDTRPIVPAADHIKVDGTFEEVSRVAQWHAALPGRPRSMADARTTALDERTPVSSTLAGSIVIDSAEGGLVTLAGGGWQATVDDRSAVVIAGLMDGEPHVVDRTNRHLASGLLAIGWLAPVER